VTIIPVYKWTPPGEWCVLSEGDPAKRYLSWALTNRGLSPAYRTTPQWFDTRKEAESLIETARQGKLGRKYDSFRLTEAAIKLAASAPPTLGLAEASEYW